MRNLNYLNCVEIDEFDLVADAKHYATRQRLANIRNDVSTLYGQYLNNFQNVQNLPASEFDDDDADALRGCYSTKTNARDALLGRIIAVQTDQFKFVCPYCLILPRTTYDHYIPQEAYPVYSILVRNLLPCCTTCNGHKLEYWRANGSRTIIHFHNDLIPNIQFLFAALAFNAQGVPFITFTLNQSPGISNALYAIIQTHFTRLNLLNRYKEAVVNILSEIQDDVAAIRAEFGNIVTTNSIGNIITHKSNRYKLQFGINYWKSVGMDILAGSNQYLNSL